LAAFFSACLSAADGFTADEVLIRFRETISAPDRNAFEQTAKLTLLCEIQSIRVFLYRLPAEISV